MSINTLEFDAPELRRLLANASLFAAPHSNNPATLSVVRFEYDRDRLVVVACNRYVMSWEFARPREVEGRDPFSVPLRDIKALLAMLPKKGSDRARIVYDPDKGHLTVTCAGGIRHMDAGPHEFPNWTRFRDNFDGPSAQDTIALVPRWLGLFAKVDGGSKSEPALFEFAKGDNKPCRVSIGENFRALVVPIRNAG
jgi:hypothetical protein